MAHKTKYILPKMRSAFNVVHKENLQWFPGHMGKGLKQMQQRLKQIDCIIEVHDARIPFSGLNLEFKNTVSGIKPHILVLNKKDLIPKKLYKPIQQQYQNENKHVVFTNCKDQKCEGTRSLMPLAQKLIIESYRFNRSEERELCIMIIGVPNVGKSSLINGLRNRFLHKSSVAQVGGVAGVTRSVLNKIKICQEPLMYLIDTPGILTPSVANLETGLKLALCSCLQDHLVGPDIIADFALFTMNKNKNFAYVDYLGLDGPTDDISEVLATVALKLNKLRRIKNYEGVYVQMPDIEAAAFHIIKAFRNGNFGKICLDQV